MTSPLMQRSSLSRRSASTKRGRTNWPAVVVLLTLLHLSATLVYYTFFAGRGHETERGMSRRKVVVVDLEGEVALLREQLAQSQELLREERLTQRKLLSSDAGSKRAHQPIDLAFPLGVGVLETKSNNMLPDKAKNPTEPFFTVIVSFQNQSHTIERTIESVFAQTYLHWELILVNENSKDDTPAACERAIHGHKQHPVTFVSKRRSTGLADGLNRGLELARGDWIVALDASDQLMPTFLGHVADGAAMNPQVQVFLGCMNLVMDGNRTWCFPEGWSVSGLSQFVDLPLGFAVRRDLISNVGGFDPACPESVYHWNFWLSTLRHRPKVQLLPTVTLLHAAPLEGRVSKVELDEAVAMVRTMHPDLFEPSQLLTDHEVIAAMSTESLTALLARCYQFPSHPMLPFWKGLYWEAQNEHAEAIEFLTASVQLAQNSTEFTDRWQQHFWLALLQEAKGSLAAALMHARLALAFNHFDELLQSFWRIQKLVNAPPQELRMRAVPYYWSTEEEVERIRQQSLSGKLGRLTMLEEVLPRTWRKHAELVTLLDTVQKGPCTDSKAARGSLNLVHNPHFKGRSDWFNHGLGFDIDLLTGRTSASTDGHPALSFQSFRLDEKRGAMQSVLVDQAKAEPLLVSAWHKSKAVAGAPDRGYGLLLELHYINGSSALQPLVPFTLGTHDWEDVSLVVSSSGAISSIDVSILFENHSGQLWVDDISVAELRRVACHCPPKAFYDPTPNQDCSPCPPDHLCVYGFKVEEQIDALVF